MPLSALVAQATLTVVPSTNVTSEAKLVPALDFTSPNFVVKGLDNGISPILSRISSATISIPAVLPMDAVYLNSTYDLNFKGPSLNCHTSTGKSTDSTFDAGPQNNVYGNNFYMATLDPNSTDTLWFKLKQDHYMCILQNTTYRIHTSSADSTAVIMNSPSNTWAELDYNDTGFPQDSYRAYMAILARLFVGRMVIGARQDIGGPIYGSITSNSTSVASTALESLIIDAADFAVALFDNASIAPLDITVTAADRALARNLSFELLVEGLSYNITLSLFSDRRYW
jgi:hypothetical protein